VVLSSERRARTRCLRRSLILKQQNNEVPDVSQQGETYIELRFRGPYIRRARPVTMVARPRGLGLAWKTDGVSWSVGSLKLTQCTSKNPALPDVVASQWIWREASSERGPELNTSTWKVMFKILLHCFSSLWVYKVARPECTWRHTFVFVGRWRRGKNLV